MSILASRFARFSREEKFFEQQKKAFQSTTRVDELRAQTREIEVLKNELIQRCHVHSFTYDFHLRVTSKYLLTNGPELLFAPGFNTNAFLIDFLQYYGCRPSFARNCIYEERAIYAPLRASGAASAAHMSQ